MRERARSTETLKEWLTYLFGANGNPRNEGLSVRGDFHFDQRWISRVVVPAVESETLEESRTVSQIGEINHHTLRKPFL